jgi:hypothetical protein
MTALSDTGPKCIGLAQFAVALKSVRYTVESVKRTPLRRASKRRAAQLREYHRLHGAWLLAHPVCEICRAKRSTQVHHSKGRIGNRLNATEDWIAICSFCHEKIHSHAKWARENGYLK